MTLITILGRLPALSLAELESVFGSNLIKPKPPFAAQLEFDGNISTFNQLGGTQKAGKVLTRLNTTGWRPAVEYVKNNLPELLRQIPEGKITLGISVYGIESSSKAINGTALEIKRIIKQSGRSVRVVPNKTLELNSAQVHHNKLTSPNGMELLFIKDGSHTIIARTVWAQDIDAYAARDQARPMRDARVGMLPPKLAQIIINLSGYNGGETLLDPFCGTGVILQEGLLMAGRVIGTDLEPRMIEYSKKNLDWLGLSNYEVSAADATSHTWKNKFDTIACETYLGRPLSSTPNPETLNKIIQDCNTIHKKFLQNIARQTKPGFKMCIAVPAWYSGRAFKHLPVLDHLQELGYNRLSFVHSSKSDLIYHRSGQIVAREIIVLIRK